MSPEQPAAQAPKLVPPSGPSASKVDFSALQRMPTGGNAWMVLAIVGIFLIWPFFIGIPMVAFGIYKWYQIDKKKGLIFDEFIRTNGWQFDPLGQGDYVATSLLGVGHDQQIAMGFGGSYRNREFHAVHYRYVTGSGRSQEEHNFLDLFIDAQQTLPLIVLDSKSNKHFGFYDHLPERIPGGKEMKLEGDFNDKYAVTIMPNSEQDVLQFLTPDFMQDLMSAPMAVDIEIEANKCFAIAHTNDFSLTALTQMFAALDIVIDKLEKIAGTWQASSSNDSLQAMAAEALIPRSRLALQPKHFSIGAVIGVIIYLIAFATGLIGH